MLRPSTYAHPSNPESIRSAAVRPIGANYDDYSQSVPTKPKRVQWTRVRDLSGETVKVAITIPELRIRGLKVRFEARDIDDGTRALDKKPHIPLLRMKRDHRPAFIADPDRVAELEARKIPYEVWAKQRNQTIARAERYERQRVAVAEEIRREQLAAGAPAYPLDSDPGPMRIYTPDWIPVRRAYDLPEYILPTTDALSMLCHGMGARVYDRILRGIPAMGIKLAPPLRSRL
jgi:hypothetical protein